MTSWGGKGSSSPRPIISCDTRCSAPTPTNGALLVLGSDILLVWAMYSDVESRRVASSLVSAVSWVLSSVSTCSRDGLVSTDSSRRYAPTHGAVVQAALRSHALARFSSWLGRRCNRGTVVRKLSMLVALRRIATFSFYTKHMRSSLLCLR